jgi:hypothetical protein
MARAADEPKSFSIKVAAPMETANMSMSTPMLVMEKNIFDSFFMNSSVLT